MDNWDLFDKIDIEDMSMLIALGITDHKQGLKQPRGESATLFTGGDYLRDLLNCGNDKRIYSVLRMKKDTFKALCLFIRKGGHLKDSREVLIEQQVFIFLWIIIYGASHDSTGERFGLTREPISR
jgi:hypothetical protein